MRNDARRTADIIYVPYPLTRRPGPPWSSQERKQDQDVRLNRRRQLNGPNSCFAAPAMGVLVSARVTVKRRIQ